MSSRSNAVDEYLTLIGVAKSYDGRQMAVSDVNLTARKGEFVTFLGPSGSGKTTTLMMISGFENPTAGSIVLGGNDITMIKPYQRNIGMVFQNYALFPHMTVWKNVAFPLRMRSVRGKEMSQRVGEVLELVGLSEHATKHPRELSGGQQQRVALARGLVFKPELLLLDEPLGALDKNLRERMQIEIKRVQRETGVTMVYVTHDQSEAMSMSDRIVVFNRAKIEQIGLPSEIYDRPASRFVGEFVGDSNFLTASLDCGQSKVLNVAEVGQIRVDPLLEIPTGRVHVLLRPERIGIASQFKQSHPNKFDFSIEKKINFGEYCLLIGRIGNQQIRIRTHPRDSISLSEGQTHRISWDIGDMHIVAT
jgi:putative spermidine/putrescine transport system ATP-binding protein